MCIYPSRVVIGSGWTMAGGGGSGGSDDGSDLIDRKNDDVLL